MINYNRHRLILAFCSVFLTIGSPHALKAQSPVASQGVVVVIPDSFPSAGTHAVVIRDFTGRRPDFIVLDRNNATPRELLAGLQTLRRLRSTTAPVGPATQVVTVMGFVLSKAIPEAQNRAAQSVLSTILGRERKRIGNLGLGRWLALDSLRFSA